MTKLPLIANGTSAPPNPAAKALAFVNEEANAALSGVEDVKVAKTLTFISLGCPKNTVDSERMLGKLAQDGYALQPDADGADVVVVNTCGFIEPARQESLAVIREMLALKKAGKVGAVVVAGCMAERQREVLLEQVPEVDQIVGVFGREDIVAVVDRAVAQQSEQRSLFRPAPVRALEDTARLRITPRHFAYLKISEGCDRLCTYCAIPKMRGKHVTKSIEEVIREAHELAADGVRELIIVAQDTTYYGFDLYGRSRLAELLRELDKVPGIEWIRTLYAYPEHISDEIIDTFAGAKKIIPYLDMPLQHINDRVLKHDSARGPRRNRKPAAPLAGEVAGPRDPHHVHHRLPRRNGRGVRGTAGVC
jgi:ribosomal protein S12 methylthiotransferase